MATVIHNKKELIAFFETTPLLEENRALLKDDGMGGPCSDWAEVLKELCKEVWRTVPRPPGYGKDWGPWFKLHLEEVVSEATSIVL